MNLTTLKELLKLLNTYIQTGRQTDSDIKRTIKSIKYIQTDRQADRQTDRQTDRWFSVCLKMGCSQIK